MELEHGGMSGMGVKLCKYIGVAEFTLCTRQFNK
jgi:hypothetical protein